MDLANAGLCDAEDLGDLGEAEVFKVIHGEDFPLHVGELLKAFDDEFDQFLFERYVAGIWLVLIGDDIVEAGVFVISRHGIEFHVAERADFIEEDRVFLAANAKFVGNLSFCGWAAERRITQPRWNGKSLSGEEFLVQHVIPNFYFHVTTTYAILRHNGVPVGKRNYLGDMPYREAA